MRIGTRELGRHTFVIAEIGSNHDNDLDQAKRLVAASAKTGVDAAKFQLYRATELYPGRITEGAIPDWWLPELQRTCRDEGVEFLCSVFSIDTLNTYLELEPAAVKIASPEATDYELLLATSYAGVPVILATGACTEYEVEAATTVLGLCEYVLLHCVSAYPADPLEMNLLCIPAMAGRYGVPVGLSDHTEDVMEIPCLAVAVGACVIEKHVTFDKRLKGPDHAFALTMEQLAVMVTYIRDVEVVMGDGVKRPTASEDPSDRRMVAA